MLLCAYALAITSSTMQLLVWGVITPDMQHAPDWHQCTTVWFMVLHSGDIPRDEIDITSVRFYGLTMVDYQVMHLCLTFWLPFAIIVTCYAYTSYAVCKYNYETKSDRWRVKYCAEGKHRFVKSEQIRYSIESKQHKTRRSQCAIGVGHQEEIHNLLMNFRTIVIHNEPESRRISQVATCNRHLRSKPFIISCLIVVCYFAFWLPYSTLSLLSLYHPTIADFLDNKMYVFQALIHLNTVVSPFLYGFRD